MSPTEFRLYGFDGENIHCHAFCLWQISELGQHGVKFQLHGVASREADELIELSKSET
jgi:hypothetical protein